MKNIVLFFLFLSAFASIISAKTDSVSVADSAFIPSSFDAAAGDTIIWTLFSGNHTTTSTLVPAGATTWNYSFSEVGDSYCYIVSVEGVYKYHCSINPDMKASFETQVSLPFSEDFDFPAGDLLSNHGWTAHSGIGTQSITLNDGGLTFPDYQSSGGNAALLDNNGEDTHRLFESVTSGSVYASFLVNIANNPAGYFVHYAPNPHNTINFRGRVWVKGTAPNMEFGLSFSSSDTIFTAPVYSLGTTYLLVVKYEVVAEDMNDAVSLFVFADSDPLPLTEPNPTLGPLANNATFDINPGSVNLRQYNSNQNIIVDGISIGTSWNQVIPVEIYSFTTTVSANTVYLNWRTSSEINNKGFEIQRKTENSGWTKIAFIKGQGTSTKINNYFYADNNLESGHYYYRLKQVDFNGTYEYSNVVTAEVTAPAKFDLAQNFPNPFNPTTKINFSIPSAGSVKLTIYNLLGEKISTIINGFMKAGSHTVNFSGRNLNSGLYFYKLESNGNSIIRKMILLK